MALGGIIPMIISAVAAQPCFPALLEMAAPGGGLLLINPAGLLSTSDQIFRSRDFV
jgi:hypothetical protein